MSTLSSLLYESNPEIFEEEDRRLVLMDACCAETLKHNGVSFDRSSTIVSLDSDINVISKIVELYQPQAVFCLMMGTSLQLDHLKKILRHLNMSKPKVCLILPSSISVFSSQNIVETLSLKFLPFQISIAYLPFYLCPYFKKTSKFELYTLSNHLARNTYEPCLSSVSDNTSSTNLSDRVTSLADRITLKLLTHELAGALLSLGITHKRDYYLYTTSIFNS
jgi:hypothetical protein